MSHLPASLRIEDCTCPACRAGMEKLALPTILCAGSGFHPDTVAFCNNSSCNSGLVSPALMGRNIKPLLKVLLGPPYRPESGGIRMRVSQPRIEVTESKLLLIRPTDIGKGPPSGKQRGKQATDFCLGHYVLRSCGKNAITSSTKKPAQKPALL